MCGSEDTARKRLQQPYSNVFFSFPADDNALASDTSSQSYLLLFVQFTLCIYHFFILSICVYKMLIITVFVVGITQHDDLSPLLLEECVNSVRLCATILRVVMNNISKKKTVYQGAYNVVVVCPMHIYVRVLANTSPAGSSNAIVVVCSYVLLYV